jgi:hypothetical protein
MEEKEGEKGVKRYLGNKEARRLSLYGQAGPSRVTRAEREIGRAAAEVGQASQAFEARWTRAALRRVDSFLADRLSRQSAIWYDVLPIGDDEQIVKVGRALVRGYQLCVERMEQAGEPDDAYLFGKAGDFIIAIGCKASAARVAQLRPGTPHYTPDEIALLLKDRDLSAVHAVMAAFPGAEIVETRKAGVCTG